MDYAKESLKIHYALRGKIEMTPRAAVDSMEALSLAYTPGVAQPCLEIQKDVNKSYDLRPVCLSWRENASSLRRSAA